jgi:hypothetical protein
MRLTRRIEPKHKQSVYRPRPFPSSIAPSLLCGLCVELFLPPNSSPQSLSGLKCRPANALQKSPSYPTLTKCKTYCPQLPALQVPYRISRRIAQIDSSRGST